MVHNRGCLSTAIQNAVIVNVSKDHALNFCAKSDTN